MRLAKTPFQPFVAAEQTVPEFTWRALFLGIVLGVVFGAGNAYLGLKVGTTVSASIPAAVMSMAILRVFSRHVSILEHNLTQTIASVGEGIAAGVIFTVPALYLLGEEISTLRIFMLAALGGVLGILFMIPMRRYIIVKEHGVLPFPEGSACAEILRSAASGRHKAILAIAGIGMGAVYKLFTGALHLWKESPVYIIKHFHKTEFAMECTPALLGVGFIVGPRISTLMFAGGALAWWVLIPLIHMFATGEAIIYPGQVPIAHMSAGEIWSNYIRYIGAGTVATGGLISLFNIAPVIGKTLKHGATELFLRAPAKHEAVRTDRDISLRWLIIGSVAIILALWVTPSFSLNFVTIMLLVILGFFFVAVTSLTVGIVGSTSNPVSGMTITTLLITCIVFVGLGWTERVYLIAALTMSVVANVAICLAGTTSQDLKTGFLLGATPRLQQIAEIIGIILPAFAVGGTLHLLNTAYGVGTAQMPAPQGTMMYLIANGVINGHIPYTLVIVGAIIGCLIALVRLPILPIAIGLYLPLSLSTAVFVGGLVSLVVAKRASSEEATGRGILAASGLIAGDACMGVLVAFLAVMGIINIEATPLLPDWASFVFYALIAVILAFIALGYRKKA